MDEKKKKFHQSNLKLKLNKLNELLTNYKNEKQICLDTIHITDLQNYKQQIQNIESTKNQLLSNIKNIKDSINTLSREKSILILNLKKLPDDIQNQLQQEEFINKEEIQRINETLKELNNNYIESIYNLFDSKNELQQQINSKTLELELQINELNKIQTDAHSNRHTIIQSLKDKKQQKLQHIDLLQNFKNNINSINTKINKLKLEQEQLKLFKSKLIDSYYDLNIISIIPTIYNENFKDLDLNNQIDIIDSTILRLDKEINNNIIILNKIQLQYNAFIKNNNQQVIEHNLYNHKKQNFKDEYKSQKEIKLLLEQCVLNLQDKYINFENICFNPVLNEYYQKINELYIDKKKANERLDIMKNRIQEFFLNTKNDIDTKINSIDNQLKMKKDEIDNINNQIMILDTQLQNNNTKYNNLIDIEDKIIKLQNDIYNIEKDIEFIG